MKLHSYIVARGEGKQTLAAFLRGKLNLSWSKAKELVEKKQVRVAGQPTADPARRLRVGNRVEVHGFSAVEPKKVRAAPAKPKIEPPKYSGPMPSIVFEDDSIVVVDKPAGLTTMRHKEEAEEFGPRGKHYLPATLADLLPALLGLPDKPLRAVHRIDRDTSGLVVFARTAKAERDLMTQFREHTIERRYLALVRGRPRIGRIESFLVRDRGDGRRGSSTVEGEGQRAITHVKLIEALGNYALVECRLETGRTHQVRIHLGEQESPLCGERVYDRPLNGKPVADGSGAARPMLHAVRLGLRHPQTEEKMSWTCPLADDMSALLNRLREDDFNQHATSSLEQ